MLRPLMTFAVCCFGISSLASAQDFGMPGVMYSESIAGGSGGQLYPFDRQDPWLHGHFQRIPAYGGYSSFRPYNYRHVFSQTQIANQVWGAAHGHAYSQQFWNRYRNSYLNGNVQSQAAIAPHTGTGLSPVNYSSAAALAGDGRAVAEAQLNRQRFASAPIAGRPAPVLPAGIRSR